MAPAGDPRRIWPSPVQLWTSRRAPIASAACRRARRPPRLPPDTLHWFPLVAGDPDPCFRACSQCSGQSIPLGGLNFLKARPAGLALVFAEPEVCPRLVAAASPRTQRAPNSLSTHGADSRRMAAGASGMQRAEPAAHTNVPLRRTSLIGRDQELTALR